MIVALCFLMFLLFGMKVVFKWCCLSKCLGPLCQKYVDLPELPNSVAVLLGGLGAIPLLHGVCIHPEYVGYVVGVASVVTVCIRHYDIRQDNQSMLSKFSERNARSALKQLNQVKGTNAFLIRWATEFRTLIKSWTEDTPSLSDMNTFITNLKNAVVLWPPPPPGFHPSDNDIAKDELIKQLLNAVDDLDPLTWARVEKTMGAIDGALTLFGDHTSSFLA